ncbi:putative 1,4-beta-D-glucan cellobiohydrolase A [Aspergillus caelatus]|uniref:Glucanase n=2 Tax=Aspergillus subgen. Circumdati TaxID=2720871 RepID=A0A5N6ZML5_9EURO|nr:putative 1,4-beta-D-glucan cellobiohydrolase A [Aspergillus caelatus]KAE8358685.1 putative 1,4-beta-D-glucan cellobiohydrolase A [Aspergillus caelatus]KAE8411834.1 putative 1,4-beta-D-glucan cellobiohydrolase A [Aspergillus pseudocaelatus]
MHQRALLFSAFWTAVQAQQAGTLTAETHPSLTWQKCAAGGTCTEQKGSVVLDSNWRWLHSVDGSTNCYTGNTWDASLCPDNESCASNCALDGADYEGTYGVTTSGDALTLQFVTGANVGSRLYLMADDDESYQTFNLLNNEFTFDVDASKLPCGLNGAVYFVSMDADGGVAKYSTNKAGAKYGTGYCDSQCPRDLKFINGQANVEGWEPSDSDKNAGVGGHGSCCPEMDIWEANSISTAYTPHPCDDTAQTMCEGDSCGGTYSADRYGGTCDPDGCDFNAYRMGNESFYGPGQLVDSSSPVTVVTQFITADGTDSGALSEIKRFYVQGGKVIANAASNVDGVTGNSITTDFCTAQKTAFGDDDIFTQHGGLKGMGDALSSMVLTLSIWDDHHSSMMWLDSSYPEDADASTPGVARGTCEPHVGDPETVESQHGSSTVTYSNIKFGPIGSTFDAPA